MRTLLLLLSLTAIAGPASAQNAASTPAPPFGSASGAFLGYQLLICRPA